MGNVVLIQRGGSPRPISDYITTNKNGINWIKIGDVSADSRYILSTKEKILPQGESKSRRVFPGDLLLSNSMSFGRPYITKIEGCIHDGWLLIRDVNKLFYPEFLLQVLGSGTMLNQYKSLAAGGVVNNLNSELVQSTTIIFPTLLEQKRIGSFFSALDNRIVHQRRKLTKLQTLKQSLLQKMFV